MQLNILTGFLGSGKTTAIKQAASFLLKQRISVGVITNDQGTRLVDGDLFSSAGIPSKQVAGGCFCCNYNELDKNIMSLIEEQKTDVIFAEAVGSCTDIIATVFKPLLQFRPDVNVTVSTFTDIRLLQMMLSGQHSFDETVEYIYLKQLEEAAIIVVNKTDLADDLSIATVKRNLLERYKGKTVLFQNSNKETDIVCWLDTLKNATTKSLPSLEVDYDRYATGEAKMAWYDQQLEIFTDDDSACDAALQLVNAIYAVITQRQVPIGHIKFLIDGETKISFTANDLNPVFVPLPRSSTCSILVNVRVQETPAVIKSAIKNVFAHFQKTVRIIASEADVFSPGYPRPVYRL